MRGIDWRAGREPRRVPTPMVGQPGRSWVQPEPLGVVLIMGAWNYPVQLITEPADSGPPGGRQCGGPEAFGNCRSHGSADRRSRSEVSGPASDPGGGRCGAGNDRTCSSCV